MPATSDLRQNDAIVGSLEDSMPVISAASLLADDDPQLVARVHDACRGTGLFCIELDAATSKVLDASIDCMQRFFAHADDDPVKRDVYRDGQNRGWIPRFSEPAYQPGTVSSLEAFDIGLEYLSQAEFWPAVDGFREAATECWRRLLKVADATLGTLARAAGMPAGFLQKRCRSSELSTLRLLHYAPGGGNRGRGNVGIAAHTDFECITLLYQTAPGLELHDVRNSWRDAPIRGGRLIVMLGDMLERWTNGYFRATGHRVRETEEQRFSIVMFVAVDPDVEVAPLERFVSAANPARYRPVRQAEHIESEVRKARTNAAVSSRDDSRTY